MKPKGPTNAEVNKFFLLLTSLFNLKDWNLSWSWKKLEPDKDGSLVLGRAFFNVEHREGEVILDRENILSQYDLDWKWVFIHEMLHIQLAALTAGNKDDKVSEVVLEQTINSLSHAIRKLV